MLQCLRTRLRSRATVQRSRSSAHVAPRLLPYLQGLNSAKAAWNMLHQLHAASLIARKSLFEDRLSDLEADDEDMEAYVGTSPRGQKLQV
jgi:hypothetical protein